MICEFHRQEIERALVEARDLAGLNRAIASVLQLTTEISAPEILGRQMYAPGLDAAVPRIAAKLGLRDVALPKSNDNVCILATRLNASGGHSRVAAEITDIVGAERTTLILTDAFGAQRHADTLNAHRDTLFKRRADVLLGARTPAEKMLELYNILAAIRPSRIFLLAYHMDLVAYVAAWPFRGVVDFLHHADHQPTLGPTLPFSAHLDLTYACHKTCRRAGFAATYVGMTAQDSEAAPPRGDAEGVVIATSGAAIKFKGPGKYLWLDYAAAALADPARSIVHIGHTDDGFRAEVHAGLAERGVEASRYVFTGLASSVAGELRRRGADAYLSSYPVPGAKVNLEAMAVGLPPIVAIDADFPEQMRYDFPTATWIPIARPEELGGAIDRSFGLRASMAGPDLRDVVRRELRRFTAYVEQGA